MNKKFRSSVAALLMCVGGASLPANATMIDVTVQDFGSVGAAQSALATFTSSKRQSDTETFGSFAPNDTLAGGLDTAVGTFSNPEGAQNGRGGCIDTAGPDCADSLILDNAASPFNGRFDTSVGADGQWLDSNDVTQILWDVTADYNGDGTADPFSHLAVVLTDVGDVGGTLTLEFENGTTVSETITSQGNGAINLVTAQFSPTALSATLLFDVNRQNDGFGIDDATVAVPAPAALALFGIGLAGFGALRRRRG